MKSYYCRSSAMPLFLTILLVLPGCGKVSSFQQSTPFYRYCRSESVLCRGRQLLPPPHDVWRPNSQSRQTNRRIRHAIPLKSALTSVLGAADAFWKHHPYVAAGLTCGIKASAADLVAQRRQPRQPSDKMDVGTGSVGDLAIAKAPAVDLKRNLAYIVYGAVYQGMAQEYIYNHLYPALFGSGTDITTVLSKVLFDLLVQTTLVTLPIAYMSKALIYRYTMVEAIRRYVDDIRKHGLLTKYFTLWGPVQCLTFSVIPEHFRVTFIALVSFFWLITLSSIASRTPVGSKVVNDDDDCLLEDGQTCRIDG